MSAYSKKILPNQSFNTDLYEGKEDLMEAMYALLNDHCTGFEHNAFKLEEHHRVGFTEMSTPPYQLSLLQFLIKLTGTKRFLEIGTFIGNTTMHIANFIGDGAEVTTIEKFDEFADLARKNFEVNGFTDKIALHVGDAYEVMQSLPDNHFDFIYVDGDKGKYLELTQLAEKKLSPKGLILVDDVMFHGDVFNGTPTTDKGLGCKKTLDYYKNTKEYNKYLLPICNGVLLLKRQ